jgi:protein phosphatase 1 regulatory subunit 7
MSNDSPTEFRLGIDIEIDPDEEEIICQHYRIKRIENLNQCKKLKKLAIVASCVEEIEGLDDHKFDLEHLEVYQGLVKEIKNVAQLTNLRVLDLSFNKIGKIEGIDSLVKLEKLYLSNNRISTIEGLDSLVNLQVLELGSNKIRRITGLGELRKLKELWLGKNKIENMRDMDQLQFPHLQQLSLQSNRLTEWSDKLFKTVAPNLVNIYLGSNALSDPGTCVLDGLNADTLEEMDLSYNRLTEIPAFTKSMTVLHELWLNDNLIPSTDTFLRLGSDTLPSLQTIYLERNPVHIECPLDYRNMLRLNVSKTVTQIDATVIMNQESVVFSSATEPPKKAILKH